jgi:hypothetical protein
MAMPADLKTALAAAKEVPVDIDPIFSFPEAVDSGALARRRSANSLLHLIALRLH